MDTLEFIAPDEAQLQCSSCGQIPPMGATSEHCSLCGGELRESLPSLLDLNVNVSKFLEGNNALPMHRVLSRYAQCCNITFCLGQNKINAEQVFQPEAILPVIAIDALRIWQTIEVRAGEPLSNKDSLGVKFVQNNEGFFPYSAFAPDIGSDVSSTLRLLVFLLAARRTLGLVEGQVIDLTPRITLWDQIDWSAETLPKLLTPEGFDPLMFHHEFSFSTRSKERPNTTDNPSKGVVNTDNQTTLNPFASQTRG